MILNIFKNNAQKALKGTTEKQQVNIASKSSQQGEVKPTTSSINLDEYCSRGYNSDEKDKEAAKELRNDILSRYNVENEDTKKEEKLVKIYLNILDDAKNEVLKENLKQKADYEKNSQEFVQNVEAMMAHMMHDGTSKGDIISLSEVDFSDIKYDNKDGQQGTVEAKTTENGIEYTIYDENNKVLKHISKTFDANGMVTISTYSATDKKDLISSQKAIEFPKADDDVKYKFADGSQNTVYFKDNGNSVLVEVSKGAMRENHNVEKNADGTYNLDGKQYFTIEEIALDLNSKELQPVEAFDGKINVSSQGKINDCAVISAINSLCATEIGREAIKNAVSIDENGNMTVKFKSINIEYNITKKEYDSKNNFSSGDPEVRAIEIAWEKMLTDVKEGVLETNSSKFYHESRDILEAKVQYGYNIVTGSYANSVYELLTGKSPYMSSYYAKDDLMEQLDKLETEASRAITVGNVPDEIKGTRLLTGSEKVDKIYQTDIFGNNFIIHNLHAYAVKESDTKADGTRIITVIDPYDSSKEIVLDEATFLKTFNQAYDVDLLCDKTKPAYILA